MPIDIHNKEFGRSFRGYNEDEVNEFLDQVIKDYEALIRQNRELEEKAEQLNERLGHFTNIEESLSKAIIVAQETAEDLKANAKKEAQLILREAEKNADRIINDSLLKSRTISMEIDELKKRASVYRTRFRMLLQAQMEMLEDGDWNELEEGIGLEKSNA